MRYQRLLSVLFLGFSSGLPLGLTGTALQAWMKTENVDLSVIGLFTLAGTPYALKFLWAPLMDRYVPPFLGRRRGWLLVTQLALVALICALAFSQPKEQTFMTALLAVLTAFFSASQDIVADAYRADVLEPEEIGPGSSLATVGYRVAMLASGALTLILADHMPWRSVYLVMAAAMGIGVAASFLAPEPGVPAQSPKTLKDAVVKPFQEFFARRGAFEVVLFTVLYKLDAVLTVALMTPFFMEMGFTKTDIGAVTKGFGLFATLGGTLAGGWVMVHFGLKRSLWIFGLLQAFAGLSFLGVAYLGHHYPMMIVAIAAENFFSGMGNAAYAGFLLSMCDRRYSATQYALLSSLMAVTRNVLAAPAGYLVQSLGWQGYYVLCTVISVPAFVLLMRYDRWQNHLNDARS